MAYLPLNKNLVRKVTTDVKGVLLDRLVHVKFKVSAANATAKSNTSVLAATAQIATAKTVTAAITNPTVPRNIIVKGNASGITGNVVVNGTNYANETITETIALNGATAVEGTKAFKTVTSIVLPAETHAGTDTVSVGTGNLLGLPVKLATNTISSAYLNGAKEGTAPTVAVSSSALESNTVLLNSNLAGTAVEIILLV